jgi:pilus assembly protein Flp/PilA
MSAIVSSFQQQYSGVNNMNMFCKFLHEEEGLTTVEYAVAGGLIAAAVIIAFTDLGTTVGGVITYICTQLSLGPAGGAC